MDGNKYIGVQLPIGGGMVSNINPLLIKDNNDVLTKNVWARPIGTYTQRPSIQVENNFLGIENVNLIFSLCYNGKTYLFAVVGKKLYKKLQGDLSAKFEQVGGINFESNVIDYAMFQGTMFFADGGDLKYYDTNSEQLLSFNNLYTTNNAPKPKYINVLKFRLFLSGDSDYPTTLFASNIVRPSDDISTIQFVDPNNPPNSLDPSVDNAYWLNIPFKNTCTSGIIGQEDYNEVLYLFSTTDVYAWQGTTSSSLVNLEAPEGAISNRTITKSKSILLYGGYNGIYRITGVNVVDIDIPIKNYYTQGDVDKIYVFSWLDHFFFYLGDVKIYDIDITQEVIKNATLVYDSLTDAWFIWDGAKIITSHFFYNNGSSKLLIGSTNGLLLYFDDNKNEDFNNIIDVDIRTKIFFFGNFVSSKSLNNVMVISKRLNQSRLFVRGIADMFEPLRTPYIEVGTVEKFIDAVNTNQGDLPSKQLGYQLRITKSNNSDKTSYMGWAFIYQVGGLKF